MNLKALRPDWDSTKKIWKNKKDLKIQTMTEVDMVVATEEEVAETTMLKIGMAADTINNLKNPRMNEALQRNYLTTQEQDLD